MQWSWRSGTTLLLASTMFVPLVLRSYVCVAQPLLRSASAQAGVGIVKIRWPARPASSSTQVRIEVLRDGTVIAKRSVARPMNGSLISSVFEDLPVGEVLIRVSATVEGPPGNALTGGAPLVISSGDTTQVTFAVSGAVDRLTLVPTAPDVQAGRSVQMVVAARDSEGTVILTDMSGFLWNASAPAAKVDSRGTVTGVEDGASTIGVTDPATGRSATATVLVSDKRTSMPISVTGFNEDVVLENRPLTSATTFDDRACTWIEDGVQGRRGLPVSQFVSKNRNLVTRASTRFRFQPFYRKNALILVGQNSRGVLTLTEPRRYRSLSIAAASSNGPGGTGMGTMTINFADNTASADITYIARDWSAGREPTNLFAGSLARTDNTGVPLPLSEIRISNYGVNMSETTIDLSNVGGHDYTHKLIRSIAFNMLTSSRLTGIFALSGVPAEP